MNQSEFLRKVATEGKKIAKKSLGQNFLVNAEIIEKIASCFEVSDLTNIVEIGTGLGSLTFSLLKRTQSFVGIEKDAELNAKLDEFFAETNAKFLNDDALQFNFSEIANENTVIVSNLPYNVGTKILIHIGTTTLPKIRSMVVMLQKDVIEKITAKHGSKNYHQLGVFFQTFCEIEQICVVTQACFSPAPNVLSAVVKISPIKQLQNIEQYWKFLHKAFSYNRKMLSTIFDETIDEKFAKKRPNELKPEELLAVFMGMAGRSHI